MEAKQMSVRRGRENAGQDARPLCTARVPARSRRAPQVARATAALATSLTLAGLTGCVQSRSGDEGDGKTENEGETVCRRWAFVTGETIEQDGEIVREIPQVSCTSIGRLSGTSSSLGVLSPGSFSEAESVTRWEENLPGESSVSYTLTTHEGDLLYENEFGCDFAEAGEPEQVAFTFDDGSRLEITFSTARDCDD